jgi:hypothetical protein
MVERPSFNSREVADWLFVSSSVPITFFQQICNAVM